MPPATRDGHVPLTMASEGVGPVQQHLPPQGHHAALTQAKEGVALLSGGRGAWKDPAWPSEHLGPATGPGSGGWSFEVLRTEPP